VVAVVEEIVAQELMEQQVPVVEEQLTETELLTLEVEQDLEAQEQLVLVDQV
jgi:hypothetical protein|tara:strand:- start:255 stop:410 length:156 start_codon:yes stop_codon:yes gene_type:complete